MRILKELTSRARAAADDLNARWTDLDLPGRARVIACVVMSLSLVVLTGISIAQRCDASGDTGIQVFAAARDDELMGAWSIGEHPRTVNSLPREGEANTLTIRFGGGRASLSGDSAYAPDGGITLDYQLASGTLTLSDGDSSLAGRRYDCALYDDVLLLGDAGRDQPDARLVRLGDGSGVAGDWMDEHGVVVMSITPNTLRLCAVRLTEHVDDLREAMAAIGMTDEQMAPIFADPQGCAETLGGLFGYDEAAFDALSVEPLYTLDGEYVVLRVMLTVPCGISDDAVIVCRQYANTLWRDLDGCFFYRLDGDTLEIYCAALALIKGNDES